MDARKLRERRRRLMRQDPHCVWCGVEVVEYMRAEHDMVPSNAATIDHLYSRIHPHRLSGGKGRRILSCYQCNIERGQVENLPEKLGTWLPKIARPELGYERALDQED